MVDIGLHVVVDIGEDDGGSNVEQQKMAVQ